MRKPTDSERIIRDTIKDHEWEEDHLVDDDYLDLPPVHIDQPDLPAHTPTPQLKRKGGGLIEVNETPYW